MAPPPPSTAAAAAASLALAAATLVLQALDRRARARSTGDNTQPLIVRGISVLVLLAAVEFAADLALSVSEGTASSAHQMPQLFLPFIATNALLLHMDRVTRSVDRALRSAASRRRTTATVVVFEVAVCGLVAVASGASLLARASFEWVARFYGAMAALLVALVFVHIRNVRARVTAVFEHETRLRATGVHAAFHSHVFRRAMTLSLALSSGPALALAACFTSLFLRGGLGAARADFALRTEQDVSRWLLLVLLALMLCVIYSTSFLFATAKSKHAKPVAIFGGGRGPGAHGPRDTGSSLLPLRQSAPVVPMSMGALVAPSRSTLDSAMLLIAARATLTVAASPSAVADSVDGSRLQLDMPDGSDAARRSARTLTASSDARSSVSEFLQPMGAPDAAAVAAVTAAALAASIEEEPENALRDNNKRATADSTLRICL